MFSFFMPHQCVHCSKVIEVGSREILEGCNSCGGKFFFYIRDEQAEKLKEQMQEPLPELNVREKEDVEKEVRSILKIEDEDKPVIPNLESVRTLGPGKFELDIVSLMNRKPIVFKLQEGKYIVDIEGM
jgi:predicted  nucleic acid-binding Zn-ribbon protein